MHAVTLARVTLVVDRYALGPIRTNCYVVRAEPRRAGSGRRRSGRRRGRAAARARPERRRVRRDPRSRTATSTTSAASPTSRRAPARRSTCPKASATALERYAEFAPGVPGRVVHPDHLLTGGETIEVAGIDVRVRRDPGPLARRTSPSTPTAASSAATCSSPARSAASTCPGADWDTLLDSVRMLARPLSARDGRLSGARAADDARRRARSATRSSRSSARDAHRGAARHARRPPVRPAALAEGDGRDGAAVRALRLPPDPDAGVRGHRALQAHVRRGLRHRAEGDVHLRGPRRPLAHAAPGGHGADLPRLRRARHAPRAAAGEALHDRADVPLRGAAARPLPRALAALARGIGSADPAVDAEVHPVLRRAACATSASTQYELQLNSIGDRNCRPRTSSS